MTAEPKTTAVKSQKCNGKHTIGIDPGPDGAIVVIDRDGRYVGGQPLTPVTDLEGRPSVSVDFLTDLLTRHAETTDIVVIADRPLRIGQSNATIRNDGYAHGAVVGICAMLDLKFIEINPLNFKRALGLLWRDDDASRDLAGTLDADVAAYCRTKNDNRVCEVFLMTRHWMESANNAT